MPVIVQGMRIKMEVRVLKKEKYIYQKPQNAFEPIIPSFHYSNTSYVPQYLKSGVQSDGSL